MTVNATDNIGNTEFAVSWLLETLGKHDADFQKLQKDGFEANKVSSHSISEDSGHNSIVYKVAIALSNADGRECSYSVVLKVPCVDVIQSAYKNLPVDISDERLKAAADRIAMSHRVECRFFEQLAPHLAVRIPKVFASREWTVGKQSGFLLMEDLSDGVVLGKYDTVSGGNVKAIVQQLVEFHAEVLELDSSLWYQRFLEFPEIMKGLGRDYCCAIKVFLELVDDKEHVAPLLDLIRPLAGSEEFHDWVIAESFKELGLPTVMVHGDIWNANVIWKRDANGEALSEVLGLLDWQITGQGSPALDLTRYLILNCDGADRRRHESRVFDFYIDCLRKRAPEKVTFTASQLRRSYNHNFITQTVCVLLIANRNLFSLKKKIEESSGSEKRVAQAIFDKYLGMAVHTIEDAAELVRTELKPLVTRFASEN